MPEPDAVKLHGMTSPPGTVIEQAAAWLVRWHEGGLDAGERQALERWCAQSTEHRRAWSAAMELQQAFGQLPAAPALRALQRRRLSRRGLLQAGASTLVAAPAVWLAVQELPWARWNAAHRTTVGERREIVMADGSRIVLNTQTALDVIDTAEQRGVVLHAGEILIETGADGGRRRPFVVRTAQGLIQALGTRFVVREAEAAGDARAAAFTAVQVLEHAVRLQPLDGSAPLQLQAGEQGRLFRHRTEGPSPVAAGTGAWARGQIVADGATLADFVAELSRYRSGVLRCDPAVASLRISGVFQTGETDRALSILEETLPVRVSGRTRYWMTVVPRD